MGAVRVLSVGSVYPPHLLGGYEVMWRGVSHALTAQGHESRVLCSDYRSPEVPAGAADDLDVHRELGWYWRDHGWPRLGWGARRELERRNAELFARHVREFGPDVVTFWPMGGMSLSLITAAQRAGLVSIFFAHDPWTIYGLRRDQWLDGWSRPGWRQLRGLGERVSGLPTQVDLTHGLWVFCSEWMRRTSGLSPAPDRQIVLTPGIEPRFLDRAPVASRPWTGELLYLGRVVEQKGVLSAIEALARLPEACLTVVGSGDVPYRRRLEARAAALGVADRVHLRLPVARELTPDIYAAADVILHPVLWGEPWGLVPLEAMGVGRPVIATGQGGSADFLQDGVNCLLHPPGDVGALAAAVQRLADGPALRAELVAAGRLTAQAHTAAAFNHAAVELITRAAAGLPLPDPPDPGSFGFGG
jgi:glycogen(starch) synthase